jgi:hypothetical protein
MDLADPLTQVTLCSALNKHPIQYYRPGRLLEYRNVHAFKS